MARVGQREVRLPIDREGARDAMTSFRSLIGRVVGEFWGSEAGPPQTHNSTIIPPQVQ